MWIWDEGNSKSLKRFQKAFWEDIRRFQISKRFNLEMLERCRKNAFEIQTKFVAFLQILHQGLEKKRKYRGTTFEIELIKKSVWRIYSWRSRIVFEKCPSAFHQPSLHGSWPQYFCRKVYPKKSILGWSLGLRKCE